MCWDTTDVSELPGRSPRYFEDYVPGLAVGCGSVGVDEASIIAFAKEYDPQPFHVDPAIDGPFGGLIASGLHTTALMLRLLVENLTARRRAPGKGAHRVRQERHFPRLTNGRYPATRD